MASVSFDPTVKIIKIDDENYYDKDGNNNDNDNICSLWYTNEEYEAMAKEAIERVKDMNICGKSIDNYEDDDSIMNESFCFRGLESVNRGKIFGCAKWLNRIVFLEQERQWRKKTSRNGTDNKQQLNDVLIAEQYSKFTQTYANEALVTGCKDQMAAVSSYMAYPSLNDPTLFKIKESILDCE